MHLGMSHASESAFLSQLATLSVARLADLIVTCELSSREVVASCLEKIAEVNPTLNAVVQLRSDPALAEAEACDRETGDGHVRGPLHGVPFTIKDWIDAAGLPCSAGSLGHPDGIPARVARGVPRLGAAGGVVLGDTNGGVVNELYV